MRNLAAKIQILDKQINSFGGIFYVISQFRSSGQAALIDKTLGVKGINTKFSYSNVVENLTSVFLSGGEPPVHVFLRRARLPAGGAAHTRAGQAVNSVRQLRLSLHPDQRLGEQLMPAPLKKPVSEAAHPNLASTEGTSARPYATRRRLQGVFAEIWEYEIC